MKKIAIALKPIVAIIFSAISICAQTQSREDLIREIESKRAELLKLETALLLPVEGDKTSNAEFLRLPDTGLIRLLPREKYDPVITMGNKITPMVRGGGAYYSFAHMTHEYGNSDIGLEDGWLSTGFVGASYGIMTSLGNIPLDKITLDAPAFQFLATHTPPNDEPKARIEQTKWSKGETLAGTTYSRRLRLSANTTYLLRSVDYFSSDVLVAFRVVRIDTDGSAIILWKLLKKYSVPQIARN